MSAQTSTLGFMAAPVLLPAPPSASRTGVSLRKSGPSLGSLSRMLRAILWLAGTGGRKRQTELQASPFLPVAFRSVQHGNCAQSSVARRAGTLSTHGPAPAPRARAATGRQLYRPHRTR